MQPLFTLGLIALKGLFLLHWTFHTPGTSGICRRAEWLLMHTATMMQARAAAGHHICHAGWREVFHLLRRLPCELPRDTLLSKFQTAACSRLLLPFVV